MFSRLILPFVVLIAAFGLSQGFFLNSFRCSTYNVANVAACAVTDLCTLTGTDLDDAVTCLRGQTGRLGLVRKIQTCDANGNSVCVDATHCVDLALERCKTCASTPQLLSVLGCKARCGYPFGQRLRQCLAFAK